MKKVTTTTTTTTSGEGGATTGSALRSAPSPRSSPRGLSALGSFLALCLSATAALAADKPPAPATPAPASGDPKAFIEALHKRLDGLVASSADLASLHKAIGEAMAEHMDYPFMAERILGKRWPGLSKAARGDFLGLLRRMVEKTYVKRFKPRKKVSVRYDERVRGGRQGRVQVRSTIAVKRTRAEVWYSLRPVRGAWRIYDIVVDEASQLRTYKRAFNKVLKKDGWGALIAKMKKTVASR